MFDANVQTDTAGSLPIARLDGYAGGKPILAFLMSVLAYCGSRPETRPADELDRFSARARNTLCGVCSDLMRATINSNWDYCDGEDFLSYVRRTGDAELSEEAFLAGARHYHAAWTDIEVLIARVQTAIVTLEAAPPAEHPDHLSRSVIPEFRALLDTLEIAASRGAKQARLAIH